MRGRLLQIGDGVESRSFEPAATSTTVVRYVYARVSFLRTAVNFCVFFSFSLEAATGR
jgi:hypothetical protein